MGVTTWRRPALTDSYVRILAPAWWNCLGRTRRCGFTGKSSPCSWDLSFRRCIISNVFVPFIVLLDQDGALSCSCHQAFALPLQTLTSETMSPVKYFLLYTALVVVFDYSTRNPNQDKFRWWNTFKLVCDLPTLGSSPILSVWPATRWRCSTYSFIRVTQHISNT